MANPIAAYIIQRVFGIPLIVYGGVFTILCFLITASIGILVRKDKWPYSFNWHLGMAYFSLTIALVHALLAITLYL